MASREAALVAIEKILKDSGIAKTVRRQFVSIDQIASTQFPAIIIEDDGLEEIDWKTGGLADVTFVINLIGYVKSASNLSTAMNDFDVSIKKELASDQTLGNTVIHMTIQPYTDRSGTEASPFGWFVRPIKVMYEAQTSQGL